MLCKNIVHFWRKVMLKFSRGLFSFTLIAWEFHFLRCSFLKFSYALFLQSMRKCHSSTAPLISFSRFVFLMATRKELKSQPEKNGVVEQVVDDTDQIRRKWVSGFRCHLRKKVTLSPTILYALKIAFIHRHLRNRKSVASHNHRLVAKVASGLVAFSEALKPPQAVL